jgi:hypothetical protein
MRSFQHGYVASLFSWPFVIAAPGKTFAAFERITQREDLHVAFPDIFALELFRDRHGFNVLRLDSMHLPNHFLEHLYFAIGHRTKLTPTALPSPSLGFRLAEQPLRPESAP